jgi:hypothetical protein
MKAIEKMNIRHDEKTRKEYINSFKKTKNDKSNKIFAEAILQDYATQLKNLDKK